MNPRLIYRKLERPLGRRDAAFEDVRIAKNAEAFDVFVDDKLAIKMWDFGWLKLGDDRESQIAEKFLREYSKTPNSKKKT